MIAGEQDVLFPLHHSVALMEQIPGADLRVIKQAAYSTHIEQPAATVAAVREFCERW